MNEVFSWIENSKEKARTLKRKLSIYLEVAETAGALGAYAGQTNLTISGINPTRGSFGSAPWTQEGFEQEMSWLSTGVF
tara:strand:- start:39 stop:275 length:237 start_codon:yes stop_codon:yes gene_type:complete